MHTPCGHKNLKVSAAQHNIHIYTQDTSYDNTTYIETAIRWSS